MAAGAITFSILAGNVDPAQLGAGAAGGSGVPQAIKTATRRTELDIADLENPNTK